MDNPNPIYYRDLVTPDSSITDLIAQLEQLIGIYDEAQKKFKSQAEEQVKGMKDVSGATEEQRKSILGNLEASERLLAEYKKVGEERLAAQMKQAELNAARREERQIAKLLIEINQSEEGSYKRLSAQYRLNKMALNELTAEERKATEYGRRLEKESKAIYEEMNRLQKATGKSQLQVGQYERALGNLVGVKGRYIEILTDANKRTEMFQGIMAAIKTPIGAAIGAVGALTAAFKLWKDSAHETQQTGDALDTAMAGWQAAWDRFQKSVSTFDFSGFIRGAIDAAQAGRELRHILDETFERTSSSRLLRASMTQENAVLNEQMHNTKLSYDERLKAADQYLANMEPIYKQEEETAKRNRDAQLKYLFDVTNKRKFATEEQKQAAREEFAANIKNYNINEDLIKQAKQYNEALGNLAAREKGYAQNLSAETIRESQRIVEATSDEVKAFSQFAKQYNLTKDAEVKAYVDAEVKLQEARGAAYNDQKRIVNLRNNLEAQSANQRKKNADDAAKAERDAAKAAAEAAKEQERLAREAEERRKREIADQRAALQMSLERTHLQLSITQKETQAELNLRIAAIYQQRDIELFENRQLAEDKRQDEALINKKYDRMAMQASAEFNVKIAQRDLAAAQDRAEAEFNLLDTNERQKTRFRLQQERERLQALLRIDKMAAEKMTADEIAAIKATIEGIDKEMGRLGYNNLWELMGVNIDPGQQSALDTAFQSTKDSIGSLIDSWTRLAEAAVQSAQKQVDAAKEALDAQIEARNAGYANEVETAQKELALARKNQEAALKEQQRAQRAQGAIDSLTQASSLVTASANIWKAFSGGGAPGIAAAVAAIALMWGSFAAAKVKAAQVTRQTEQYGEGTVELLQGGSHASGNDIDLGRKRDGTRRRAEGGEYFAVINKRNSRRYGKVIPDVINAFNDGTFADKYQRANATMSGVAIGMAGGTDVSQLEADVSAIRRQGDESRFVDGQGNTVVKYKNLTRKIRS
jgi:hypothetical protein